MHQRKHLYLCAAIFLIACFLRFYNLDAIPSGLYQDETAIGYNAYSILTTGKDEHGQPFPLYFKSFGDYKLPVYIYATVASVKLFGLTPLAVRLPSAAFGLLTLIVLYLFTYELTKNRKLALIAYALTAINPWHIHYSRATFEVSIALFLFVTGAWLLYKACTKKSAWGLFMGGTVCFVLAMYTYNLTRLLAPVLYAGTVYFFQKATRKPTRLEVILTASLAVLLLIPFILTMFGAGGISSSGGTLIFSSAATSAPRIEFMSYMTAMPPIIRKILFNSVTLLLWQYIQHALGYLSVPFFFLTGSSHGNHGIGNVGQFYVFELPFLVWGIYMAAKTGQKWTGFVLFWITACVGVAALTREAPHATRSFFLIFPIGILIGFGALSAFEALLRIRLKQITTVTIAISAMFVMFNVSYYLASYFIRFPIAYAKSWRSADADVSAYIKSEEPKYEKIIIDAKSGYIYSSLLFYTQFDPLAFQHNTVWSPDDSEGFSFPISSAKYEFREVHWDQDLKESTLIITTPDQKPPNAPPLRSFYYPRRPVVFAVKQVLSQYPVEEIAYVAVSTKKE